MIVAHGRGWGCDTWQLFALVFAASYLSLTQDPVGFVVLSYRSSGWGTRTGQGQEWRGRETAKWVHLASTARPATRLAWLSAGTADSRHTARYTSHTLPNLVPSNYNMTVRFYCWTCRIALLYTHTQKKKTSMARLIYKNQMVVCQLTVLLKP